MSAHDAQALNQFILEALADGPLSQQAVRKKVEPRAPKRCRTWMKRVWSICMLAVAEGDVCYGPPQGAEVTSFEQTNGCEAASMWMKPKQNKNPSTLSRCVWTGNAARFFALVGNWNDGSAPHMGGGPQRNGRSLRADGTAFILKRDLAQLRNAAFDRAVVRLLSEFRFLFARTRAKTTSR